MDPGWQPEWPPGRNSALVQHPLLQIVQARVWAPSDQCWEQLIAFPKPVYDSSHQDTSQWCRCNSLSFLNRYFQSTLCIKRPSHIPAFHLGMFLPSPGSMFSCFQPLLVQFYISHIMSCKWLKMVKALSYFLYQGVDEHLGTRTCPPFLKCSDCRLSRSWTQLPKNTELPLGFITRSPFIPVEFK